MKNLNTFSQFLNESEENSLENYKKLLKNHDWYWVFADDHRSWEAGQREVDGIVAAYKQLSPEDKKEAYDHWVDLYKKYFPESNRITDFEKFTGY
jgi:hypothetical protein